MIKVYVMESCPDCTEVKVQLKNNPNYEVIDIGDHVKKLKEFIQLRDRNAAFDPMRANGSLGIPCFVMEDGSIRFELEGITPLPKGAACSLDGKNC